MVATFVDIPLVRVFRHPVPQAYEWLTDYRDDDHKLAGAVIERRDVVKKDGETVVLDATLVTLGQRGRGKAEVALFPTERRWQATIVEGPSRGSVYSYQLAPHPQGARLDVLYRVRVKRTSRRILLTLLKPLLKRELHKMWDGFERAMDKDLGAAQPTV